MRVRTQYFRSLPAASGVLLSVTRCLWKILTTGLQCNYMHKDCTSAIDTPFPRPSSTADTSFIFCVFFLYLTPIDRIPNCYTELHVSEEFSLFPIITVNESLDVWRRDWDLWFFMFVAGCDSNRLCPEADVN